MELEQVINVAFEASAVRFGLSPFVLDGIEVWRIRRQVKQCVSSLLQHLLHVFALMERGIIHDHNALRRQLREKVLLYPAVKNSGIDGGLEETDG